MVLLAVLAHPDDESMGAGGILHRHAAAGVDVHLLCVTRGGEGWHGKPLGALKEDLPRIRTGELDAAAGALGLRRVHLWDYPDGGVPDCDQLEITERITEVIRTLCPAAVVGWGPDGGYGHPDHIAVGACTDAAVASIEEAEQPALYHMALDEALCQAYREVMALSGEDGEALPVVPLANVGPVVNLTPEEREAKLKAIDCHQSQLEEWRIAIMDMPDLMERVYGREPFVPVSGGTPHLGPNGLLAELS
jgi:LmbE family N-acetylglucosaminyl deacetylase